jgi:hypothetical protein
VYVAQKQQKAGLIKRPPRLVASFISRWLQGCAQGATLARHGQTNAPRGRTGDSSACLAPCLALQCPALPEQPRSTRSFSDRDPVAARLGMKEAATNGQPQGTFWNPNLDQGGDDPTTQILLCPTASPGMQQWIRQFPCNRSSLRRKSLRHRTWDVRLFSKQETWVCSPVEPCCSGQHGEVAPIQHL